MVNRYFFYNKPESNYLRHCRPNDICCHCAVKATLENTHVKGQDSVLIKLFSKWLMCQIWPMGHGFSTSHRTPSKGTLDKFTTAFLSSNLWISS